MTGTISEDRMNEKNHQVSAGVNPIDSIFVQFDGRESPAVISNDDHGEGHPVKQKAINKVAEKVRKDYYRQIVFSVVRNACCWMFLICLVVILCRSTELHYWPSESIAVLTVCCGFGLLGTVFHVYRAYNDLTFQRPTLVALMLRDAMYRDDLAHIIQTRQLSPPEISTKVSLRSGALSYGDATHWTRRGRSVSKEISYRSWADQSKSIQQIDWPAAWQPAWILVKKDFRCVDELSKHMLETEVAEFRKDTGFDINRFFMEIEFDLQWKEGDSCNDVEVYLVFDEVRPYRYNLDLYRASWLVALDSVIRIMFHFTTKRLDDYSVVKFIEK